MDELYHRAQILLPTLPFPKTLRFLSARRLLLQPFLTLFLSQVCHSQVYQSQVYHSQVYHSQLLLLLVLNPRAQPQRPLVPLVKQQPKDLPFHFLFPFPFHFLICLSHFLHFLSQFLVFLVFPLFQFLAFPLFQSLVFPLFPFPAFPAFPISPFLFLSQALALPLEARYLCS